MRKIFLHIMVSLDGFIEDRDHELHWHCVDEEFERYINEVLRSIGGMIFGRIAHARLARYWPTAGSDREATSQHVESARMMRSLPKYVISKGGYRTEWENSHVIEGDVAEKVRALKREPGKDIALFAGAKVFRSLDALGLVDEYRIIVNPILLCDGTPLFQPGGHRSELRLLGSRRFESGAVVLSYAPADKG